MRRIGLLIALGVLLVEVTLTNAQSNLTSLADCPSSPSVEAHFFLPGEYLDIEIFDLATHPVSGELTATRNAEIADYGLYAYDSERQEMQPFSQGDNFRISFFDWSPDGAQIAALAGSDGKIAIWDAESGMTLHIFDEHTPRPTPQFPDEAQGAPQYFYRDVSWSPDGAYLAAVGTEPLRVWDVANRRIAFEPGVEGSEVNISYNGVYYDALKWSPDGRFLALAVRDTIHIWETGTWRKIQTIITPITRIYSLDWSPAGYLAVGGGDGLVVWDSQTWEQIDFFTDSQEQFLLETIFSVAWSPDGCWLGIGTYESHIYLMSVTSGEVVRDFGDELATQLSAIEYTFLSANKVTWSLDGSQIFAVIYGIISQ